MRLRGADLVVEEFAQELEGEVLLGQVADLGEEAVGEDGDVGFFQTGGGEDVDDAFGGDGLVDELADGVVEALVALPAARPVVLLEGGLDGLEEGDLGRDAPGFRVAPARAKALRSAVA